MNTAGSRAVESLFRKSLGPETTEDTEETENKDFSVDGRSPREVREMKEYAYSELPQFARPKEVRKDGYFCGSCVAFTHKPNTMPKNPSEHDGFCEAYKFKDRDYGCCGGWSLGTNQ